MKLGDLVEKIIKFVTLGQGKKIATKAATLRGKEDCGCNRRQQKLNEFGDKIIPFKEKSPIKYNKLRVNWSNNDWNDVKKQVSCTCNFIEGILEVYDKNQALIIIINFIDKPLLTGKITYLDIVYPSKSIPYSATLKCRTKDKVTNPVNIKIK